MFSPTRAPEELYAWTEDPWQVNNLASLPSHKSTLEAMRAKLDQWMIDTKDKGPESDAMYDSDMRVYLGQGNQITEENIATMKRWAAEGR